MLRYSSFPACAMALLVSATATIAQTATHDRHGDPLPAGAKARLGTVGFRHDNTIVFAAFLPDGQRVVSMSDDGLVCAWEFPSGKEVRRFKALTGTTTVAVAGTMSPDGKHLTAFCDDGYMRILDWAAGKEL